MTIDVEEIGSKLLEYIEWLLFENGDTDVEFSKPRICLNGTFFDCISNCCWLGKLLIDEEDEWRNILVSSFEK